MSLTDEIMANAINKTLLELTAPLMSPPSYEKTKRKSKSRTKGEQKRARRQNRRKR